MEGSRPLEPPKWTFLTTMFCLTVINGGSKVNDEYEIPVYPSASARSPGV